MYCRAETENFGEWFTASFCSKCFMILVVPFFYFKQLMRCHFLNFPYALFLPQSSIFFLCHTTSGGHQSFIRYSYLCASIHINFIYCIFAYLSPFEIWAFIILTFTTVYIILLKKLASKSNFNELFIPLSICRV